MASYKQKQAAWNAGAIQATLDPRGPGVARLHLVPPKPSRFEDPPSLLFINGWHIIPLGSSWAALLAAFLEELNIQTEVDREIGQEELDAVLAAVSDKMRRSFPKTPVAQFRRDLEEIVGIILAIAHGEGENLPADLQSKFSMRDYARHMGAPHRMDLIVAPMRISGGGIGSRACPLSCRACYANEQPAMILRPDQLLTKEEWFQVIDTMRLIGVPMINFTGGEPLTNPDIIELVERAKWHVTKLNTSGTLMTAEMARGLAAASLDGVQITLYSHDPNIHDRLVGKRGAFGATIIGIANALDAGLNVSVNTPLLKANADYNATVRFIHLLGVRSCSCSGLIPTGNAPGAISKGETMENGELFHALRQAIHVGDGLGMEMAFTSPGWLTPGQLKSLGLNYPTCGAGLSNMAITPAGEVVPCQSWLHEAKGIGNILTDYWDDIWNSLLAKRLRQENANNQDCPLAYIGGRK